MARAGIFSFVCSAALAAMLCATSASQTAIQSLPSPAIVHFPEANANISIHYQPKFKVDFETFSVLHFRTGGHSFSLASLYELKYLRTDGPGRHPENPIRGVTMDPSHFFFTGRYTLSTKPHTLLFFTGDTGVNEAPLLVVGFREDGSPFKVLELERFNMFSLDHPMAIKPPTIVGREKLSQVISGNGGNGSRTPYATSYDPYSVYTIQPGAAAQYSLEDSKLYNQLHYVWAGPKTREDYAVVYNVRGHSRPFGVPAKEVAQALAGRSR
jgi:hypothetical protein